MSHSITLQLTIFAAAITGAGLQAACTNLLQVDAPAVGHPITKAIASHHEKERTMESPKRKVPAVEPVESGGVRYQVLRGARARGFNQNGGIIVAVDATSGNELWTLMVYQTSYDAKEEADVQDRYITDMSLSKDHTQLLVKTEDRRSYTIDLATRSIAVLP